MHASLQCQKALDVPKPLFFLGFCMVFTYGKLFAQAQKRYKIAPGACQTQLPTKIVLKTRFGAEFGRVWGSLGCHLGGSWAILGASWRLLGASWAPLGHFLDPGSAPGLDFRGFGDVWGWVLEALRAMFRHAFRTT